VHGRAGPGGEELLFIPLEEDALAQVLEEMEGMGR
jgi:hypothetical protein